MENVTDALQMAGSVLIFVLALSLCMYSFTKLKTTADTLIDYNDRETYTQYYSASDINLDTDTTRIVGANSIITMMYRAFKENIVIYFYEEDDTPYNIYSIKQDGTYQEVNYIDLSSLPLANDTNKEMFLTLLIYCGQNGDNLSDNLLDRYSAYGTSADEMRTSLEINGISFKGQNGTAALNQNGIYKEYLTRHSFKEKCGVYYEEDVQDVGDASTEITDADDDSEEEDAQTVKDDKRYIITYTVYK